MIESIASFLTDYILVIVLLLAAIFFTIAFKGVQFRMIPEMLSLLIKSGEKSIDTRHRNKGNITAFQAFMVSIASRVGTGNLAGVALAITIGGAGSIFWMWVIALLGAATSFVESTLAQLYKIRGQKGEFMGGPAYYILKGIGKRWWAALFAILITVTFGLSFNSVQSNTISQAFGQAFDIPSSLTAIILTILTLFVICGGITSIARFSQWIVPFMAIAYIFLALFIILSNITQLPHVFAMIFREAFGFSEVAGGSIGMAMILGTKRGLFSNEAGEGSTPNVAATAAVSHPVKQGLIQALGVFTDTLIICTCTALIILCSGLYPSICDSGINGIILTQNAIETLIPISGFGEIFISVAIFFFAFTSIIANYYYGETNIRFLISGKWAVAIYRIAVGAMVFIGAVANLELVWMFADITMALMTICNIAALAVLWKWARICLEDYIFQLSNGLDPAFHSYTIPEIQSQIPVWKK